MKKMNKINETFFNLFGKTAEVIIKMGTRFELIGNHTDYMKGETLSFCSMIKHLTISANKNENQEIRIISDQYSGNPFIIDYTEKIPFIIDNKNWKIYPSTLLSILKKNSIKIPTGFNVFLTAPPRKMIPKGGFASSAVLLTGILLVLNELFDLHLSPEKMCLLAQETEHKIGTPCGLLDQYSILFSQENSFTFLDHSSAPPKVKTVTIPLDLLKEYNFLMIYDPESKHALVDGKYGERRSQSENGLKSIRDFLGDQTLLFQDISDEQWKIVLENQSKIFPDPESLIRSVHQYDENKRVIKSIEAIKGSDPLLLAEQITRSGESAISNYDLAEDSLELLESLKFCWMEKIPARNHGGGFCVSSLMLIPLQNKKEILKKLQKFYRKKFHRKLNILPIKSITPGYKLIKSPKNRYSRLVGFKIYKKKDLENSILWGSDTLNNIIEAAKKLENQFPKIAITKIKKQNRYNLWIEN